MSDRGLRYWLSWPHTKQDHVVVFVLFFCLSLAAGYFERPLVSLLAAVLTVLVGVRLMAWNAEQAAAGETEDAPLSELLGMGGSWDRDGGADGGPGPDDRRPSDGGETHTTGAADVRDAAEDGSGQAGQPDESGAGEP